jgi:hypothetical protein
VTALSEKIVVDITRPIGEDIRQDIERKLVEVFRKTIRWDAVHDQEYQTYRIIAEACIAEVKPPPEDATKETA